MTKIILGTANLGVRYGLLGNKFNVNDFRKSIQLLKKKKHQFIETSLEYKNSLKIINKTNIKDFRLTLKANFLEKNEEDKILRFKEKNNIKKFYCIMLHNPDVLLKNTSVYKRLRTLKENNLCDYIGISFYNYNNFFFILKKFKFDVIQVPLNIFDQRLLKKITISFIKKKKIIVQARSIFLQGLLLKNKHKFSKENEFLVFKKWLMGNIDKSRLYHCINFIKLNSFIKFLIIGASSFKDVKYILNKFLKKKKNYDYNKLAVKNKKIISPDLW